jgi:hypothetical protein
MTKFLFLAIATCTVVYLVAFAFCSAPIIDEDDGAEHDSKN